MNIETKLEFWKAAYLVALGNNGVITPDAYTSANKSLNNLIAKENQLILEHGKVMDEMDEAMQ